MNNIMILHNGRCGSTVVGNLLAQNPNMALGFRDL